MLNTFDKKMIPKEIVFLYLKFCLIIQYFELHFTKSEGELPAYFLKTVLKYL